MEYMTDFALLVATGIYSKAAIGVENQRHEKIKKLIHDASKRRLMPL